MADSDEGAAGSADRRVDGTPRERSSISGLLASLSYATSRYRQHSARHEMATLSYRAEMCMFSSSLPASENSGAGARGGEPGTMDEELR